jgi:hypothetical protein
MSAEIIKNGKKYPLGFVPQSLYDDVEDLKDELDSLSANDVAYDSQTTVKQKIDEVVSKIDGRAAGTYIGTYISISDSRFGIYVPYDVKNKGVPPRFTDLNLSYVAYYNENIRVVLSNSNGIIFTSDNLPQNAKFIGRTATIVIIQEN